MVVGTLIPVVRPVTRTPPPSKTPFGSREPALFERRGQVKLSLRYILSSPQRCVAHWARHPFGSRASDSSREESLPSFAHWHECQIALIEDDHAAGSRCERNRSPSNFRERLARRDQGEEYVSHGERLQRSPWVPKTAGQSLAPLETYVRSGPSQKPQGFAIVFLHNVAVKVGILRLASR